MENQRLLLVIAISVVSLVLYTNWIEFSAPKKAPIAIENKSFPSVDPSSKTPVAPTVEAAKTPSKTTPGTAPDAPKETGMFRSGSDIKLTSKQRIKVRTDVLQVELDTLGADIRQVDLIKYPVSVKKQAPAYRIMLDKSANLYVAEASFAMPKEFADFAPHLLSEYTTAKLEYELTDEMRKNKQNLEVKFAWADKGVTVTKTYTFKPGKYDVDLLVSVENKSGKIWKGSFYRQLKRSQAGDSQSQNVFLPTYFGSALHSGKHGYEKVTLDDISKDYIQNKRSDLEQQHGGWVAMLEQFFLGAWIPAKGDTNKFYSLFDAQKVFYTIGIQSPLVEIAQSKTHEFRSTLYIGPKTQDELAKLSPGLERSVDYGWLTILSEPLFWLLGWLHRLVGNWGWAIILLTLLIKMVFYKLSETSYRSMAKMKNIHPRLQALKDRFGTDRQGLHQAMMELYRKEKINPLGGCLPILVQIPVFIALYYVLLESVEIRQAPFIFWLRDLSIPDPWFVLPLLMGVTMLLQHKLNPAPLDPIQQKVMMMMPIVFTVFFMFFPAGLVLYWVINNILSIAQQAVITKRITGKPIFARDS